MFFRGAGIWKSGKPPGLPEFEIQLGIIASFCSLKFCNKRKEAVGLPINILFPAPLILPLVLYGGWNMSLFNQAESRVGSRSQILEFQKLFFFHRNLEHRIVWQNWKFLNLHEYIHYKIFHTLLCIIDISNEKHQFLCVKKT